MKTFLSKTKLIIHADDFGVSKSVTDNICSTFDNGILTSTSIIPNGHAFRYAMKEYNFRSKLNLSIHINLVEGKPLSPSDDVSLIIGPNGEFNQSFLGLWFKYLFSKKENKKILNNQVKKEIRAQINRVIKYSNSEYKIRLDSHLHYHMIPFVFQILNELNQYFHFSYIRIPNEKLFFPTKNNWKNYLKLNLAKNVLLKILSINKKNILNRKGILTSDYFMGVLFSGKMSFSNVISGLIKINKDKKNKLVEILFHPGGAKDSEKVNWENYPQLKSFYFSEWRKKEKELLENKLFQNKINSYDFILFE